MRAPEMAISLGARIKSVTQLFLRTILNVGVTCMEIYKNKKAYYVLGSKITIT